MTKQLKIFILETKSLELTKKVNEFCEQNNVYDIIITPVRTALTQQVLYNIIYEKKVEKK